MNEGIRVMVMLATWLPMGFMVATTYSVLFLNVLAMWSR